jgi:hypothetical protein
MAKRATGDRYGKHEYRYARPIAEALRADPDFRAWFIGQTRFAGLASTARLLDAEQMTKRTRRSATWWRSHYAMKPYPYIDECGERETDLLAIFETPDGFRFALHVEVKSPEDDFQIDQAQDYGRRAKCWMGPGRAPQRVLEHADAATVLCCERRFAVRDPEQARFFESVVAFEDVAAHISPYPDPT